MAITTSAQNSNETSMTPDTNQISANQCQTTSLIPLWVTITFASLSFFMIIVTIAISVKHLKNEHKFDETPVLLSLEMSSESDGNKSTDSEKKSIESTDKMRSDPNPLVEPSTKSPSDTSPDTVPLSIAMIFHPNTTQSNMSEEKEEYTRPDHVEDKPLEMTLHPDRESIEPAKSQDISVRDKRKRTDDPYTYSRLSTASNPQWNQLSITNRIKLIVIDVCSRKAIYLPVVAHFADTATDFASIVEFGLVANNTEPHDCGGLNVMYLFVLSICAMVAYRVLSAYKIWQITDSSCTRTILQLFDVELYHVLYFSHQWGLKGKSSPQRMLSVLESVFESAPQSVIQLVYLMHTSNGSSVVIASTILSFVNLTMSIVSDDKQSINIQYVALDENEEMFWKFIGSSICLYCFRIMDVCCKLLIYAFAWRFVNGYTCFALLLVDVLMSIALYAKTKTTDALLGVIAMPISLGGVDFKRLLYSYRCFTCCESLAVVVFIWIWVMVYNDDVFEGYILGLWIFCTVGIYLKLWCGGGVLWLTDVDTELAIKERTNLCGLLQNKQYDDAIELLLFKNLSIASAIQEVSRDYRYYGSLLHIAIKSSNDKVVYAVSQEWLDKDTFDGHDTELTSAIQDKRLHHVEFILISPQLDIEYLMKGPSLMSAFCVVISVGDIKTMNLLIQSLHRVANKKHDPMAEIAHVLNNGDANCKYTLFHDAVSSGRSLEWFVLLYAAYGSTSNANAALFSNTSTPLLKMINGLKLYDHDKWTKQELTEWINNKRLCYLWDYDY
eukprot:202323_1